MSSPSQHERHMCRCIELARQAVGSGDSPVASLIVDGDQLVSEGVETVRARHDATAHAEMEALPGRGRWPSASLLVTRH